MTLIFALLVTSFLLYVESRIIDFKNNNDDYQSLGLICYICTITGLSYYCRSEGYTIENSKVFNIKKSIAKQFNLI